MDSPRSVAFIHPSFERFGTPEHAMIQQILALKAVGFRVTVFTAHLPTDVMLRFEEDEIDFFCLSAWWTTLTLPTKRSVKKAGKQLKNLTNSYTAFVAYTELGLLWAAQALNFKKDDAKPLIWCAHKAPFSYFEEDASKALLKLRPLLESAVGMTAHFFPSSAFTSNRLNRLFGIHTSPHYFGIDLPMMHPLLQERIKDSFSIGTVSDLEPGKNVSMCIESFAYFLRSYPAFKGKVKLDIIGEGSLREALEEQAKEAKIGNYVRFLGRVEASELRRKLQEWEVVLLLPLQAPWSRIVLEAGVYGKPVIVANQGGLKETIADGESGFLVDPSSPQDIADRLHDLCAEPTTVMEMGRRAQDIVFTDFDAEEINKVWIEQLFKTGA